MLGRSPKGQRALVSAWLAALLLSANGARAVLVSLNDPLLPASADGNNLTLDTSTGLEWLDLDASAGRTYADLTGGDGSANDFAPGGVFAGLRYATALELTGNTAQGQIASLWKSGGTSTASSSGNYAPVRGLLTFVGCSGSCATYGYAYGTLVHSDASQTPLHTAKLEAFPSQGLLFGETLLDPTIGPRSVNQNVPVVFGNWLVRAVPEPEPAWLLGVAAAALGARLRRPRR